MVVNNYKIENLEKELYTVENYNKSIENLIKSWKKDLATFASLSAAFVGMSLLPQPTMDFNILQTIGYYLKFSWYISLPYLSFYFANKFIGVKKNGKKLLISKEEIIQNDYSQNKIIFHIVTKGTNYEVATKNALKTKEMNEYVKEKYGLNYDYEVRIVTEEEYKENFKDINDEKIRLVVVPKDFKTERGSKYKGRALEYSRRIMLENNLLNENNFIYYQDEESFIGEDTIFGILDFIKSKETYVGRGIILYPRNFKKRGLDYWEFYRSGGDLDKLIISNRLNFHGSHFVVNSKVLKEINFDNEESLVEDFVFYNNVVKNYGENNVKLIKGFCYESPPLSVKDFLKQRGRWFTGILKEVVHNHNIPRKRKILTSYYLTAWLSALPSLVAVSLSTIAPTSSLFHYTLSSILSAYIIFNIFDIYKTGYQLNRNYIQNSLLTHLRVIKGLLMESLAPWVALYRYLKGKVKDFDVIRKV
ncbi:MAG: glycosyltransferase family 2 protein [Candidatus Aenigmatarchaeota archaeon]